MSWLCVTGAWEVAGKQPGYVNQVAALKTELGPRARIAAMLKIEANIGRVRTERYGARIIDLDVLLLGDVVLDETGVQIPHPRLHERAFVLVPLAEIAPNLVHPGSGVTIEELLDRIGSACVRLARIGR